MGSIIEASCLCGYKREMFLGGGMLDFTTSCNFPIFCGKCSSLFEANLLDNNQKCPKCHSPNIIPYDDNSLSKNKGKVVFTWDMQEKLGRELILTDSKYLCPNCGQFLLSFLDIGVWD